MARITPLKEVQTVAADETQTGVWTQRLAQSPALGHAVIWLQGDLGAGKTTFVRHLLRALGVQGPIKSPTYAIVEPHHAPISALFPDGLSISHLDFYRFSDPREWEDAGFRELFAAPGLKLVEWPEKAADCLPLPDLELSIETQPDDQRLFAFQALSPTGLELLNALAT
jgi:tRNA threonylcarbamoyladenosine biosynthesis protein TsaE